VITYDPTSRGAVAYQAAAYDLAMRAAALQAPVPQEPGVDQ
jgi:hypothetical protein